MNKPRLSRSMSCMSQLVGRHRTVLVLVLAVTFTGHAFAQQCSNVDFVKRIYGDLLFRPADASGLAFFVPLVSSTSRQAVAQAVAGSQEYDLDLVGGSPTVVAGFY